MHGRGGRRGGSDDRSGVRRPAGPRTQSRRIWVPELLSGDETQAFLIQFNNHVADLIGQHGAEAVGEAIWYLYGCVGDWGRDALDPSAADEYCYDPFFGSLETASLVRERIRGTFALRTYARGHSARGTSLDTADVYMLWDMDSGRTNVLDASRSPRLCGRLRPLLRASTEASCSTDWHFGSSAHRHAAVQESFLHWTRARSRIVPAGVRPARDDRPVPETPRHARPRCVNTPNGAGRARFYSGGGSSRKGQVGCVKASAADAPEGCAATRGGERRRVEPGASTADALTHPTATARKVVRPARLPSPRTPAAVMTQLLAARLREGRRPAGGRPGRGGPPPAGLLGRRRQVGRTVRPAGVRGDARRDGRAGPRGSPGREDEAV